MRNNWDSRIYSAIPSTRQCLVESQLSCTRKYILLILLFTICFTLLQLQGEGTKFPTWSKDFVDYLPCAVPINRHRLKSKRKSDTSYYGRLSAWYSKLHLSGSDEEISNCNLLPHCLGTTSIVFGNLLLFCPL